ncbi:MAG: shikimate kinase [Bacteroidota bacterium]|nr:shikimate kinase [Bacteroidota bacterium]
MIKSIYLIGYMGSGKTTLGRKLANRLGYSFIDLDKFIEEKYFRSIPQIFEEEGECGFREKEHKALEEIASFSNVVVATGGGAPCFYNNIEIMNQNGATLFIDVDAGMLASRLKHSKGERPLVKDKSPDELLEFICQALEQRRPYYEQALYCVRGGNLTVDDLLKILETPQREQESTK